MKSEVDVLHYYRQFIVLSKPLLDSQRLTPGVCDRLFWQGFHKRDCLEMSVRLIAEHPHQPVDVHFDYLDIFEVARAILGNPDSETELEDSSDGPRGMRNRHSECTQEPRYDREERKSWGADYIY